ncbi:MAG: hypothetical protein ACFFD7_03310 [Candidatus Thorarchaeota archaeon]
MGSNSLNFLTMFSVGLLIISLILLLMVSIEQIKKKFSEFIVVGIISIPIIFLIPVILGLILDL